VEVIDQSVPEPAEAPVHRVGVVRHRGPTKAAGELTEVYVGR
jgi:hypothetical protein